MTSSLTVAIVGVGGTILASAIGAYVNLQNSKQREKYENSRVVSDYYLEEKTQRLIKLYDTADTVSSSFVSFVLNSRENNKTITKEKFNEYREELAELQMAIDKSALFLTDKQEETVRRSHIILLIARNSITEKEENEYYLDWDGMTQGNDSLEYQEVNFKAFRKHTRLIQDTVKEELNKPIKDIGGAVTDPEAFEEIREMYMDLDDTEMDNE